MSFPNVFIGNPFLLIIYFLPYAFKYQHGSPITNFGDDKREDLKPAGLPRQDFVLPRNDKREDLRPAGLPRQDFVLSRNDKREDL
ncbi:MAG: hypothetical protein FWG57_07750, partial [Endomicrobia bacterium]|nr:hypothetical protein [Endomicrobiia bacterium]